VLFEGGQENLYVYVGNDTVNAVDPSGMAEKPKCGGDSGKKVTIKDCYKEAMDRSLACIQDCSVTSRDSNEQISCNRGCTNKHRVDLQKCTYFFQESPLQIVPYPAGSGCELPDWCLASR
jgi:hypothetical protein